MYLMTVLTGGLRAIEPFFVVHEEYCEKYPGKHDGNRQAGNVEKEPVRKRNGVPAQGYAC